jgi:hypothetical protein
LIDGNLGKINFDCDRKDAWEQRFHGVSACSNGLWGENENTSRVVRFSKYCT